MCLLFVDPCYGDCLHVLCTLLTCMSYAKYRTQRQYRASVYDAVQVYSIGPTFVERVMCRIVEQVAEEICRLFQCVPKFSESSAIQVLLLCSFIVSI